MSRKLNKGIKRPRKNPYHEFTEQDRIDSDRKRHTRRRALPRYTSKLDALLGDVVRAFSVLKEPPAESFTHKSVDAYGNPKEPLPELVTAMKILGDSKGESINAENVKDASTIMYYVKPDAFLWLVPKILVTMQQWWAEVLRVAPEKEKELSNDVFGYAAWRNDRVCDLRAIISPLSIRFCRTRYSLKRVRRLSPEGRYQDMRLRQHEQALAPLMTRSMRLALRAYLVEWYRVLGKGYSASKWLTKEPRRRVYDCWL